jgi:two-component system, OmpR family, sensor histidine kinase MprB
VSLRWRLAIALALLSGIAVGVTAWVAYASTEDRLTSETDEFLADRMAPLLNGRPGPRRDGDDDPDSGQVFQRPVGRGPGGLEFTLELDTVTQFLSSSGAVSNSFGAVELPVNEDERALATAAGDPVIRSVTVEGVTYRVRTASIAGGGALQVGRDISETERVLDDLRLRFALIGFGVVTVAAAGGWFVARRSTAPIEHLAGVAERVAHTGDLTTPIETQRRDETGRLARSFATMLEALGRSREQQRRLVQDAGHELRTPLTSMRTNLEVLERHADLPAAKRQAILGDLRSELAEITGLVNELIQLASEQQDDEPLTAISLGELVSGAAARAARRHGREFSISGEGAVIEGRRAALDRAVTNLLDNAAKFSPAPAPIEVTLDAGKLTVRDHGPGIPEEDLAHVFERFYRAAAARPLPGSGLGLSIVRQVVEGHGGCVFARNEPDGGAAVGFEVPVGGGIAR